MPKLHSPEVRARAIALLLETGNASVVAKKITAEFPGTKISKPTVTRLAANEGIDLQRGRPVGVIEDKPRNGVDPEIAHMAEAALGEEGSLRKAAAVLGISHTQVKKLTSVGK